VGEHNWVSVPEAFDSGFVFDSDCLYSVISRLGFSGKVTVHELSDANVQTVAEIFRRLDGIPLAAVRQTQRSNSFHSPME
jgi:hypothetical protein